MSPPCRQGINTTESSSSMLFSQSVSVSSPRTLDGGSCQASRPAQPRQRVLVRKPLRQLSPVFKAPGLATTRFEYSYLAWASLSTETCLFLRLTSNLPCQWRHRVVPQLWTKRHPIMWPNASTPKSQKMPSRVLSGTHANLGKCWRRGALSVLECPRRRQTCKLLSQPRRYTLL